MGARVGDQGTPEERLLTKCIPEPNSGCWLWFGAMCNPRYGYGTMFFEGRRETAHRASWLIYRGPIPDQIEVDHRCRNPACVNPEHLRLKTKAENLADRGLRKVCWQGHPLYSDNLTVEANGAIRRCKECRNASRLRYRMKKEERNAAV